MIYDLFSKSSEGSDSAQEIYMPDAEVCLYSFMFSEDEANQMLENLLAGISWTQEKIHLYGKEHNIPRMTAWHGEPDKTYIYSGIRAESMPWTPTLLKIKERIERVSDVTFNSVLLNLYRNGSDSVSWHADDEPELGRNPTIGSVSFGESRTFQMKHKWHKSKRQNITLHNGSYLLMKGTTQHHWLHQIPKSKRQMSHRINLTYRVVK